MKIAIISDTWLPQVNGVVRTLRHTCDELRNLGHIVDVIGPHLGASIPCPGYPEVRLALRARRLISRHLSQADYDAIHVSTEGPLGLAARRWCVAHQVPFTSAYHTRFPEYLRSKLLLPNSLSHTWLRRFHQPASVTMVRSRSQARDLRELGYRNLEIWPGAVDTQLFRPNDKAYLDLPRPISMYLGRVADEKNLPAFLNLKLPGSKVVVGDGPALKRLRRRYPEVQFLGYRHGETLARCLAAADVMVFPSRVETLGLVMLEAMACGVPVAAYPVPGPLDIVVEGANGSLHDDLETAVYQALAVDPEVCVDFASDFSWRRSTEQFLRLIQTERQDSPRGILSVATQH